MITIGIVGANGQVGTEVCLFLNNWEGVKVIAICRNRLSSAILRKMGVECRHGAMSDSSLAKVLLSDCDLVADFTLPKGAASEINAIYKNNIQNTIENLKLNGKYVFISSLMAFGMKDASEGFRNYWIPKTVYGATKRFGESAAFKFGKKYKIPVFVLRLGEVHGLMQNCSKIWREFLKKESSILVVPNSESYSVFCYTIAEALINIGLGKEKPGKYSLISNPPWTYKDLFFYLAKKPVEIEVETVIKVKKSWYLLSKNLLISVLKKNKNILQAHILKFLPEFEQQIKLRHWTREILRKKQINENISKNFTEFVKGISPGKRISSITDSRNTMNEKTMICENVIQQLVNNEQVGQN